MARAQISDARELAGTEKQRGARNFSASPWRLQTTRGHRLVVALALMLAMPTSGAPAQAPPPAFSMHPAPRPLPEIRFENGDGEAMSLADFRGNIVLLNIWATWCAPCRREMPTLERLRAELGGPDFEVVALSIDRQGLPAVREFYAEVSLETLPIYVDQTGAAQRALNALGLPTTLLLDREGNEVGRLLGPAEWDSPEMVAFLRDYLERTSAHERRQWSRLAGVDRDRRPQGRATFLPLTGMCSLTRRSDDELTGNDRRDQAFACARLAQFPALLAARSQRHDRVARGRGRGRRAQLELAGRRGNRAAADRRPAVRGDVCARAVYEQDGGRLVLDRKQPGRDAEAGRAGDGIPQSAGAGPGPAPVRRVDAAGAAERRSCDLLDRPFKTRGKELT
jgi:thiol-disulfide isomerase/thioredoxin